MRKQSIFHTKRTHCKYNGYRCTHPENKQVNKRCFYTACPILKEILISGILLKKQKTNNVFHDTYRMMRDYK